MRTLLPLLEIDRHPLMEPPLDVVTDARHVRHLDDAAFRLLLGYVRRRLPDLGTSLRRHAIVNPPPEGVAGAAIAGLYNALGPTFAANYFLSLTDAFAWLGRPDGDLVASEVEHLTAEALPDPVGQLRAFLARKPGANRLSEAAEALGVSARSLQRASGR